MSMANVTIIPATVLTQPTDRAADASWPLTTFFTPPASCETRWVYDGNVVWGTPGLTDAPECLPDGHIGTRYSPGVCGAGMAFQTITKLFNTATYPVEVYYHGMCCRNDFTLLRFAAPFALNPGVFPTPSCVATFHPPFTALTELEATVEASGGKSFGTTVLTDLFVHASSDPFHVYWHESDLTKFDEEGQSLLRAIMRVDGDNLVTSLTYCQPTPLTNTGTTTTGISGMLASPASTRNVVSASAASNGAEGSDGPQGLSTVGIIGICISIATLIVAALLLLLYRYRRDKRQQAHQDTKLHDLQRHLRSSSGATSGSSRRFSNATTSVVSRRDTREEGESTDVPRGPTPNFHAVTLRNFIPDYQLRTPPSKQKELFAPLLDSAGDPALNSPVLPGSRSPPPTRPPRDGVVGLTPICE